MQAPDVRGRCPDCGEPSEMDDVYCAGCGALLEPVPAHVGDGSGQRRIAVAVAIAALLAGAGLTASWVVNSGSDDALASGPNPPPPPTDPGVRVLREATAGPYEYVVIQATSVAPMLAWLREHRYFVPDGGREVFGTNQT